MMTVAFWRVALWWSHSRGRVQFLCKSLGEIQNHTKNTIFAIFNLLYLNHHNSPTIENLVADIQLILEELGAFTY